MEGPARCAGPSFSLKTLRGMEIFGGWGSPYFQTLDRTRVPYAAIFSSASSLARLESL